MGEPVASLSIASVSLEEKRLVSQEGRWREEGQQKPATWGYGPISSEAKPPLSLMPGRHGLNCGELGEG